MLKRNVMGLFREEVGRVPEQLEVAEERVADKVVRCFWADGGREVKGVGVEMVIVSALVSESRLETESRFEIRIVGMVEVGEVDLGGGDVVCRGGSDGGVMEEELSLLC